MKKYRPRDKILQKMSRDGLTEKNCYTEETRNISSRENETDLLSDKKKTENPSAEVFTNAKHLQQKAAVKKKLSRLHFTEEECADPRLEKYIRRSDKSADRLDAAREAVPKKKTPVIERTFDETSSKAKTRLCFEEKECPPGNKPRGSPLSFPLKQANRYIHGKITETEKENAGIEGAHKAEQTAEHAVRYGIGKIRNGHYRHRLKPYKKAAQAEITAEKANVNFYYHKLIYDSPQLSAGKNTRFRQKQQIKKQYAEKARKQGVKSFKGALKNIGRTSAPALHCKKFIPIALFALILLVMFMAGLSSCSALFSGGVTSVAGTSYSSSDADMLGAEADYKALEKSLREEIDNVEQTHSGYDEYRYELDEIGHDPYVLTSILTALKPSYTRSQVQSVLHELFEKQYTLTFSVKTEKRTRTESRTGTYTDAYGTVHTYQYGVEVEYTHRILTVTLENAGLSAMPPYFLDEEQLAMYEVYINTLGNRPDLFPITETNEGETA